MSRTGTWWGSREWRAGPLRLHLFRMPRSSVKSFSWAYKVVVEVGRLHALVTLEPAKKTNLNGSHR